ncbi:MAG TPA: hypothetical protein VF658_21740 [Pyrinomonadaceae bacterium]|jgi:uncharacterized membrane protein
MEKKTKYDTNPLDPDYVKSTDEMWGATRGDLPRPTEDHSASDATEAPTRRYDTPLSSSYPSVFVPPVAQPPTKAQATTTLPSALEPPTSRNVPGINVPENVALIVPYIPYYIGAILAAVELFLVPRGEVRVRFHAAQGLAMHLFVIAVQIILNIIGGFTGSRIGSTFFTIASIIFFIISLIRVWKGEPHHVAPLDEPTRWLNQSIEPRK